MVERSSSQGVVGCGGFCCCRGGPRDVRIIRTVTRVADGCCDQAFRFAVRICVDHTVAGREIDS